MQRQEWMCLPSYSPPRTPQFPTGKVWAPSIQGTGFLWMGLHVTVTCDEKDGLDWPARCLLFPNPGNFGTQMHTGTTGTPGPSEDHGWRDPSGLQRTNLPFVLASHFLF